MLTIEGHAIISADGMIADGNGEYPAALKNDADWAQYQRALDRAVLVVTGRRGHERHPNPGRRRLVLTRSVARWEIDQRDGRSTLWNPAGLPFDAVLDELGVTDGMIAITGVFDLFVGEYTSFLLSESNALILPGGTPCFAAGHPRTVLTNQGMRPGQPELIDPMAMVTTTLWSRG
jgi:hypothetical protein